MAIGAAKQTGEERSYAWFLLNCLKAWTTIKALNNSVLDCPNHCLFFDCYKGTSCCFNSGFYFLWAVVVPIKLPLNMVLRYEFNNNGEGMRPCLTPVFSCSIFYFQVSSRVAKYMVPLLTTKKLIISVSAKIEGYSQTALCSYTNSIVWVVVQNNADQSQLLGMLLNGNKTAGALLRVFTSSSVLRKKKKQKSIRQ